VDTVVGVGPRGGFGGGAHMGGAFRWGPTWEALTGRLRWRSYWAAARWWPHGRRLAMGGGSVVANGRRALAGGFGGVVWAVDEPGPVCQPWSGLFASGFAGPALCRLRATTSS